MLNMKITSRPAAGFSLIELMVALVAGLIVVGAALAFTMSSLRANTEFINSTRLTQELRANLNLVTDELRRAGYDEAAMNYVGRPVTYTASSPFANLSIPVLNTNDSCVVFAYDRLPGNPGQVDLGNGEIRAFRRMSRTVGGRTVGVLEFAESAAGLTPACNGASPDYTTYPPACDAGSGWCAVSDPRVVDITVFRVDNDFNNDSVADGLIAGSASTLPMILRRVEVEIRGRLLDSPDVVRGVRANVRVRADCVRAGASATCGNAPSGT
jgi:prepilin-type N-terminal cleavage/methylation domain-containing protein